MTNTEMATISVTGKGRSDTGNSLEQGMREAGYISERSRGGRRKGGFTLIALLVVLALVDALNDLPFGKVVGHGRKTV